MSGSDIFNLVQFGLLLPAVALLWYVLWRQKQNPNPKPALLERFARWFMRKTDGEAPPDQNNDKTPSL